MDLPQNNRHTLEDFTFIGLVIIVTIAFAWLLAPYFGAVLWGLVAAILFEPATRRLEVMLGGRKNLAAGLMLILLLALFIVPALLIGNSLVNEATALYAKIRAGEIDFGAILNDLKTLLPDRLEQMIQTSGRLDFDTIRREFGSGIASGLQTVASRALLVGQGAVRFFAALGVMLYLTFFLLRDGDRYAAMVRDAVPLRPHLRDSLFQHFVVVVRATMKGTVVVAIMQGLVGGIIFSLLGVEAAVLWGVLMGFLSLLPAVGTALVWIPVSIYLFATGQVWQAIVLVLSGTFIIGMIDNILRPILVGRDTRMPDFVVLIATLAGLDLFGLNGFIVGPIIAALFIAVWNIVTRQKQAGGLRAAEAAAERHETNGDDGVSEAHPS